MGKEKLTARVDGAITIRRVPQHLIEVLRQAYTMRNPEYDSRLRLGKWTGDTPEEIDFLEESIDGDVRLPRGNVLRLRKIVEAEGYTISFQDARSEGDPVEFKSNFTPRDYQAEGIAALKKNTQGIVVLPCGGGKTKLGLGSAIAIGRTTLILVCSNDLLEQWCDSIREDLGIEPGVICGNKKVKIREITVASIQKLDRLLKDDNNELIRHFGLVIMDEAHHTPAKMFFRVLRRIPARWRLGLTATPDRQDGLTDLTYWSFGEELIRKTVPDLIKAGVLMVPTVKVVRSEFSYDFRDSNGKEIKDQSRRLEYLTRRLEGNRARAELVCRVVAHCAEHGQVLVLANRQSVCLKTAKILEETYGIRSIVLTSKRASKTQRKATIEAFKDPKSLIRVVIATSLADEGLDIRHLSRVVMAWPERAEGSTMQRAGRLQRPDYQKEPELWEIVDSEVKTLKNRWDARRRVYQRNGFPIEEVDFD